MVRSLLRRWIRGSILTKGLKGNSTFWMAMGALNLLHRYFAKNGRRSERIAMGERLRPGDELLVRYPGQPNRATRREIAEVTRRRNAELQARRAAIATLERSVDRGGFRGRKAAKQLRKLVEDSAQARSA